VAIVTANALRHRAFASMAFNSSQLDVVAVFHEDTHTLNEILEPTADLEHEHLSGRDQAEQDVFGLYMENQRVPLSISKTVPRGWFSTPEFIEDLERRRIELILVYGTSIIKGGIIKQYDKRIVNVHLGLSPYYRGSGTNYFPFVNREPEYCGATYMYLDSGVDTGQIIHQIRPHMLKTDSFHQLSNRFLIRVFKTYLNIAESYPQLEFPPKVSPNQELNKYRRTYKDKDFNRESLESLYMNFSTGMLEEYIGNIEARNSMVPLVRQEFLGNQS